MIRQYRTDKQLTQEQLANLANIPLSQIGRLERGNSNPTITTLQKISIALKVPLYNLIPKD